MKPSSVGPFADVPQVDVQRIEYLMPVLTWAGPPGAVTLMAGGPAGGGALAIGNGPTVSLKALSMVWMRIL